MLQTVKRHFLLTKFYIGTCFSHQRDMLNPSYLLEFIVPMFILRPSIKTDTKETCPALFWTAIAALT